MLRQIYESSRHIMLLYDGAELPIGIVGIIISSDSLWTCIWPSRSLNMHACVLFE